ncbi:MAG: lysyl oxidase family protein [Nocardioidaceae bacterium]
MRRSAVLSVAALAIAGLPLGGGASSAETHGAKAAESPLKVWAPTEVSADSYGGYVYSDLGIKLVAGSEPFEIWSHRPTYDDPIQSEWRSSAGTVALPEGTMTTFAGLDDFLRIRVRRASDGKFIQKVQLPACLNGYGERARPDAPATSPYPYDCPSNPYTVGSVMGVQAGFAATPVAYWENPPLHLKPGTYDVSVSIPASYRSLFGISGADGRRDLTLTVADGGGDAKRPAAPRQRSRGLQPAAHRPTGAKAGKAVGPMPDLRALPAFGIQLNGKGDVLRFGANVWNAGDSPLVVDGFRRDGEDEMDAYQYFFDASGEQTGYQQVGTMHWHAANHNHWHFEDFAQYQLLDADQSAVVKSTKQSFCLASTDAVDYTVPDADWHPYNTDLSTACGDHDALSVREVLASGNGDTYYQYRAGQAFRIGDLPNGIYYISVESNPLGNLVESDTTNNDSLRKIQLGGKAGKRWVKVFPVGIVTEGGCGLRTAAQRGC